VSPRVRFEPEASDELDEAALWYEHRSGGLGTEFLNAIDQAVAMITRWPHAAPLAADLPKDLVVRRAPVSHFPYHLVYLETAEAIRVLAVAHDAKRPGYWRDRLLE